eukprot:scaffold633_cov288-Ochromonas_danica.AAC.1
MLSDEIDQGVELLLVIYKLHERLKDKQKASLLLYRRLTVFDRWFLQWTDETSVPSELSIQSLLTLLTEIQYFMAEAVMISGLVDRIIPIHQSFADKLDDFYRRIDQHALELNIPLDLSEEEKRREEEIAALDIETCYYGDSVKEYDMLGSKGKELASLPHHEEAMEALNLIGDIQRELLNKVFQELSQIKKDGVSIDEQMKRIRKSLLVKQADQNLLERAILGDASVLKELELLLADNRVDVNQTDKNGRTPIFVASEVGRVDVVRVLLADNRVDVNQTDKNGRTPIYVASQRGNVEVVSVLLLAANRRVDVNKPSQNGWTPIHVASEVGRVDVVRVLLADNRVDVNQTDK